MSPVGPIGGPNYHTSTVLSHDNIPLMNTTIPQPMTADEEVSISKLSLMFVSIKLSFLLEFATKSTAQQ